MMRSGNDAAVAIAEHLAGSEEAFIAQMNTKAQVLGAVNTHFRNPHGLTAASHYSTAFDLAWITRYALANPVLLPSSIQEKHQLTGLTGGEKKQM